MKVAVFSVASSAKVPVATGVAQVVPWVERSLLYWPMRPLPTPLRRRYGPRR